MNRILNLLVGIGAAVAATAAPHALAQQLATQSITTGLTRPVWAGAPRGDTGRLFVIESRFRALTSDPYIGRIKIVNLSNNTVNGTLFLSFNPAGGICSTAVGAYISEQGLLGMAFHPDYLTNGYFYIHHTRGTDAAVIIARMRANAPYATSGTADPASYTPLLTVTHPQTNHNGGWMDFGPDGNLYFAIGDGGNGNDQGGGHIEPGGNAQNLTVLLGKIGRIDVDGADNIPGNADDADAVAGTAYRIPAGNPFSGAGQRKEIWLYGLRNPWRNSFDRATGDLWIGDVGQDVREEVNVNIGNVGGRNYGWRCMEGTRCTGLSGCTCNAASLVLPILEYAHPATALIPPTNMEGVAITGGYVYRGCDIPWFQGHYLFTDYGTPTLWSLKYSPGTGITNLVNRTIELDPPGTASIVSVSSFAEDGRGEMYIIDQSGGKLLKVVAALPTFNCTTCVADVDDGTGTGTRDGGVGIEDLLYYLALYDAGTTAADVDNGTSTGTRDGGVGIEDLLYYLERYDAGC
jgi:glucose/arabinose dehydrogenase